MIGFPIQTHAEFYKWVDEKGVTRFSNTGATDKYKDSTSKAEEAKYADQPESPKENIIIINNLPAPVVVNNNPATPSQNDSIDEIAKLERNRLQELMKDKVAPYSGRGYTANEGEAWKNSESRRKERVKKDLDLLNKDPRQYFHNKPMEERQEADRRSEDARNSTSNHKQNVGNNRNPGPCMGGCASENGICVSQGQGNGQCIGNCAAAHGRCVARCN